MKMDAGRFLKAKLGALSMGCYIVQLIAKEQGGSERFVHVGKFIKVR